MEALAAENARLQIELAGSVRQQSATAEVLKVISGSAFDLQRVFETVAENAVRLCEADKSFVFRFDGELLRAVVALNASVEMREFIESNPLRPGRHSGTARAALERRTIHIPDVLADPEFSYGVRDVDPVRTVLAVPMLKGDTLLGVMNIYRLEVKPFTDKQIALVETFANQAAIAIENARLLTELRESLDRQTATSEVLGVISSSPGELKPVFDTILENAMRLCEAEMGYVYSVEDGKLSPAAARGGPPEYEAMMRNRGAWRPDERAGPTQAIRWKQPVLVDDLREHPLYAERDPTAIAMVDRFGLRTLLHVPMLKDDEAIDVIILYRREVRPFIQKHIDLVADFAAQAVIAIENARLLTELRESLERRTAMAEVLAAISASPGEVQPVFEAMLDNAVRICGASEGSVFTASGDVLRRIASRGLTAELVAHDEVRAVPGTLSGRMLSTLKIVHIPDLLADLRARPDKATRAVGRIAVDRGARSVLWVPMIKDNVVVGAFVLLRRETRPFTEAQIGLVETFANQAIIAIENARLLSELRAARDDAERALGDLTTAQDRLIQTEKLASLGQLTAGIAHEIKNPLNFVNNFSALSCELIEELGQALRDAPLGEAVRVEVEEIAGTLRGNLDRVVEHGKRADSIVKNMLLHSRAGSGEHRPVDINTIVEESLNLAYHGARAERQGFNVALERSFDPAAGEVDLFPQEITRVLLNMISNGFHATAKRKAAAGGGDYQPTVAVATKDLGDSAEIRIRDNGTGIPPEVKNRIFDPFFTSKPVGEGTGLGLSISHDIVVKQHGGRIEIDTRPGEFTEFRIVLPRAGEAVAGSGGRA